MSADYSTTEPNGATVLVTVEQFRADFSEFADETKFPESNLLNALHRASKFVSRQNSTYFNGDERVLALELMAAHIYTLSRNAAGGSAGGGLVNASTVGSVSVSLTPPLIKRQFDYWCNQTAYGQQYMALLGAHSPVGMFLGGSFQRVFR